MQSSSKQEFKQRRGHYPSNIIPVVVVENHNDVLPHLFKSLASRYLPLQGNVLLHFDSHPDLSMPKSLREDELHNKDKIISGVDISSWIAPVLFNQHINHLVWLKPYWSDQISCGKYEFHIGIHKIHKRLSVTLGIEYFISELECCPLDELLEAVPVTLTVLDYCQQTNHDPPSLFVPDSTKTTLSQLAGDLSPSWILDVDLDSFGTIDPFKEGLAPSTYKHLKYLYRLDLSVEKPDNMMAEVEKRREQITTLQSLIGHFLKRCGDRCQCLTSNLPTDLIERVEHLVSDAAQYNSWPVEDVKDLHEPGMCIPLPHHIPSNIGEIDKLVDCCIQCIRILVVKPRIITIARSSWDEYCPKQFVENIQLSAIAALEEYSLPKSISILKDYSHYE